MSYINRPAITIADGPNADAFQRLRTSQITTLFDSKFIVDTGSLNWVSQTTNNATASLWSSSVLLNTSASSAIVRQSRRRMNYQSGKSQLIVLTANFVAQDVNTIKRVGYFDNSNGIYFVYSGSQFGVGIRNNAVDTFISQSTWNLDTYNGSGTSGNTLNITASQIYFMDFEWLGVGRIRYGIYQGGIPTYVHQISNINSLPYNSPVYMASPNLPVRYELINSGSATSSLVQICSTVISEGGYQNTGPIYSIDNAPSGHSISNGQYSGSLAIRLKSGSLYSTVLPTHISVTPLPEPPGSGGGNTPTLLKWSLLLNPVTSSNPQFVDAPNSSVQYSTASTFGIINEGIKLASGFTNTNQSDILLSYDETTTLGAQVNGQPDVIVLAINGIAGTINPQTYFCALGWQESL